MNKPYVVSADIEGLLLRWARRRHFDLPNPAHIANFLGRSSFCDEIRVEFSTFMQRIFPALELVPEIELQGGLAERIWQTELTPVSLERAYTDCFIHRDEEHPRTSGVKDRVTGRYIRNVVYLDMTRLVDDMGNDRGLGHRSYAPPLPEQLEKLKEWRVKEVALVDDVIFTGALLERVIQELSQLGINVPLIIAGIGVAEGIHRVNQSKREVWCVRTYKEVIDQVCERDFYPGVPFSGRSLIGGENVGVPYLLPFGKPGEWASIPEEWQRPFSRFCIEQTIKLFAEIERISHKPVLGRDLSRLISTPEGVIPQPDQRVVEALGNQLERV